MRKFNNILLLSFFFIALTACEDKVVDLPDNYIAFTKGEVGLTGAEVSVELDLTRALDATGTVKVSFSSDDVVYGKDFITDPAAVNNTITLSILQGQTKVQFKVLQQEVVFLSGTEKLNFKIIEANSPLIVGSQNNLNLTFSKIISSGGRLTLESKTTESEYANTVYADLSSNSTNLSDRKLWNLAFTNDNSFRVILNYSYQTTAAKTTKNDITQVSLKDVDTTPDIYLPASRITDPATETLVDSWDGDLTKTVFDEVSSKPEENFVYLVAFEGSNNPADQWYKVKVDRSGGDYKVQYARIGDTEIKTVTISKDSNFNFSFLSFEKGLVKDVEPKSKEWDIEYGYVTYNSGLNTPYWFRDFININSVGGTQAAEVLTSTVSYENYKKSNVSSTEFSNKRDAIAGKWRVTSGQELGIKKDRFYVIKDSDGNVYKLKFVNMGIGNDGGERGKPIIEYELID